MMDLIRNTLRTPVKATQRTIKTKATDTLVKLLLKIDPSFLVNAKFEGELEFEPRAVAAGAATPAKKPRKGRADAKVSHALVINEQGVISSPEIIRLLLRSAFPEPEFESIRSELIDYFLKNTQLWGTHDSIAKSAKEYLQKQSLDPEVQKKYLERLDLHEETTKENRLAYSMEAKPNPQGVFWPNPTMVKRAKSIFDEMPYANIYGIINEKTPIGSGGSCFATEIAHRLQAGKFNYVLTEPYADPANGGVYSNACARWGSIFNTSSFRQLIEKAFEVRKLPKILWSQEDDGKLTFRDPFRERVLFDSVEEYEANYDVHIKLAREALLQTKVFVMTLGMNEIWALKADGSVFSQAPWKISASLVDRKLMTVEENLFELQTMLDIWRAHNPDIKLIISVSPVPLHATFRAKESHIIAANCHSKSLLRVVADEFVRRNKDVFYFPGYELTYYCIQNPWHADQRHLSPEAITKVMDCFSKMFVSSSSHKI